MAAPFIYKKDLVHPELSYKIIGCAFEVIRQLGAGQKESIYQKALASQFKSQNISFKQQVHYPVHFNSEIVGKNFLDFLVEGKVIVEIKRNHALSKPHFDQVINYLRVTELQLALLIYFGPQGVTFKRLVNIKKD